MGAKHLKIVPDVLFYRGEGNESLVARIRIPEEDDKIIKLFKQELPFKKSQSIVTLKKLKNQVYFVKYIMQLLLDKDFVHCPDIIFLSSEQIQIINQVVSNHRPNFRCFKGVNEADSYALMFPDFCSFPRKLLKMRNNVISIEIKPKQGFMNPTVKSELCMFCMMQYYKLQSGSISVKSKYCPMNLFSGCLERIKRTIVNLFDTPQNNFRIFIDGNIVYSEERKSDLSDIFCDFFNPSTVEEYKAKLGVLIGKILLLPVKNTYELNAMHDQCLRQTCINYIKQCLCCIENNKRGFKRNCLLGKILKLQCLDNIDIHVVSVFYQTLQSLDLINEEDKIIGVYSSTEFPRYLGEINQMVSESRLEYMSRKVWEFLLALTMKDCSLILTFANIGCIDFQDPVNHFPEESVINMDEYFYLFSISLIDLDFKPLSKVLKNLDLRLKVQQTYLNMVEI